MLTYKVLYVISFVLMILGVISGAQGKFDIGAFMMAQAVFCHLVATEGLGRGK